MGIEKRKERRKNLNCTVDNNKNTKLLVLSIITFIVSLGSLAYHLIINRGIGFADHQWLWSECACTLRGVDSAEAIKQGLYFQDIVLPASTSTFPWTKILGIIVHGAFLDYQISIWYYITLNVGVMLWMLYLVYKNMRIKTRSKTLAVAAILLMLSSWYLVDWLISNNNATLICAFIIIAIILQDEHETWSGVLVAFAMIKAQIVLPFCLVWAMKKKWKLLGTAVGMDLISWLISVIVTGVSPVDQLLNLMHMRVEMNEGYLVYGIFDAFRSVGIPTTNVLFLSMLMGCLTVIIGYNALDRILPNQMIWTRWSLPAIVSVFWCYKSQCDYNILMIMGLAAVELWIYSTRRIGIIIYGIVLGVLLMKPFSFIVAVLDKIRVIDRDMAYYSVNRIDLYMKCLVYFLFMCVVWQEGKIEPESNI